MQANLASILDAVQQRLNAVDPTLIPPGSVASAHQTGAASIQSDPVQFSAALIRLARINPILATSQALGAYVAVKQHADPLRVTCAKLSLGAALIWWGYHHESAAILSQIDTDSDNLPNAVKLYTVWHTHVANRQFKLEGSTLDTLLPLSEQLEQSGQPVLARLCELDAIGGVSVLSHSEELLQRLLKVKTYFDAHNLQPELGHTLVLQAPRLISLDRVATVPALLKHSESIFTNRNLPAMLAFAWHFRGIYYLHQRDLKQADFWLTQAQKQAHRIQHPFYDLRATLDRAVVAIEQGDFPKSLRLNQHILDRATELKLEHLIATAELNTANAKLWQGAYDEAEHRYRHARQIYINLGQQTFRAITTENLGIVAGRKGQFSTALRRLNEALTIYENQNLKSYTAKAHHNLGRTYAVFGHWHQAQQHLQTAIDILSETELTREALRSMLFLAQILLERDQIDHARHLLETARSQAKLEELWLDVVHCERLLGELHLTIQHPQAALACFEYAITLSSEMHFHEAAQLSRVGHASALLMLGDSAQAQQIVENLRPESLSTPTQWRYYALRAHLAAQQGQKQQALQYYHSALSIIRTSRRSLENEEYAGHFALALQSIYDAAYSLAVDTRAYEQALTFTEMVTAQLLGARLGHTLAVDCDLHQLRAEVSNLLTELYGTEWTVLRYAWQQGNYWLFILTSAGLTAYPLNLDEQHMALRGCSSPDDSFRKFAYLEGGSASFGHRQQLYQALLPPELDQRLSPDHTLIIIPTYQLHGLPFHALLNDNTPLIENAVIIYAHSLEQLYFSLMNNDRSTLMPEQGLLVAQSSFSQPDYSDLPHALKEIKQIKSLLPQLLPDISPTQFLKHIRSQTQQGWSSYDWLHIVTHTYIDKHTNTFIGLILNDDVLRFTEIVEGTRLNVRLVTLSACQTGLGHWHHGDELAGLTQAFMGAGAQSVIASLWLTKDAHTPNLMETLYKHLFAGSSPARALAAAQRAAHRAGLPPYLWATFVTFGS